MMARFVASIVGFGAAFVAVANAAPVPPPENSVQYGNTLYATLDNAYPLTPFDPDSTDCSAQYSFAVPEGWEIVSDNDETLLAIGLTPFGTDRLVVSNGKVYDHTLAVVMDGALLKMSNDSVNATATPATEDRPVKTGEVKIVSEACPARILLRRIDPVPGEPVKAYHEAVEITNFITFNKTGMGHVYIFSLANHSIYLPRNLCRLRRAHAPRCVICAFTCAQMCGRVPVYYYTVDGCFCLRDIW